MKGHGLCLRTVCRGEYLGLKRRNKRRQEEVA
jgi:hypothetical protein